MQELEILDKAIIVLELYLMLSMGIDVWAEGQWFSYDNVKELITCQ